VCALIPSVKLLNQYLYYYFECNYWKFREKAVGGNQPNYSGTMIAKFPIHLPSLLEQQEIACILDNLFEKEQRARELCDIVEKIDLMKKAILARAFRGELGTNNPPEESTMGLLTLPNKFGIS
ncbi:MAG: restriction endonuclease subunit S, partial [Firmicutes bacterium]|nr:restriction endonuclease subunit S [Bacillota bacterium]